MKNNKALKNTYLRHLATSLLFFRDQRWPGHHRCPYRLRVAGLIPDARRTLDNPKPSQPKRRSISHGRSKWPGFSFPTRPVWLVKLRLLVAAWTSWTQKFVSSSHLPTEKTYPQKIPPALCLHGESRSISSRMVLRCSNRPKKQHISAIGWWCHPLIN